MKCQFCNQELPDEAKFCFRCNKQIVCKECGKGLIPDSTMCVFCGAEIATRAQVNGMNHIKYTETESEKSFEASFSDATAGNVVETWAQFLPHNRFAIPQRKALLATTTTEDIEVEEISTGLSKTMEKPHPDNVEASINRIFKIRGEDEIYLYETSLKANSKVDYAGRLTMLYLYYQQLRGVDEVRKIDVNAILEKTGFKNDGNYRGWMTKNKSLYNTNNGSYRLCRTGEERAKEYLNDVFSEDKRDVWKLGDNGKTTTKSNSINKKPQSNTTSYSIIGALNLAPSGKDSLKEFIAKHNASSGSDYNVLFTYYLEKILKEKNINPNHIYSCYKDLGIKYPSNLRQSLVDTKSRKGWIDTSNTNDIKLTAVGENAVEHDLKK